MKVTIQNKQCPKLPTNPNDLPIGSMFTSPDMISEGVILKTYSCFVSLKDPQSTWGSLSTNTKYDLLPKGTIVTLEVE